MKTAMAAMIDLIIATMYKDAMDKASQEDFVKSIREY